MGILIWAQERVQQSDTSDILNKCQWFVCKSVSQNYESMKAEYNEVRVAVLNLEQPAIMVPSYFISWIMI